MEFDAENIAEKNEDQPQVHAEHQPENQLQEQPHHQPDDLHEDFISEQAQAHTQHQPENRRHNQPVTQPEDILELKEELPESKENAVDVSNIHEKIEDQTKLEEQLHISSAYQPDNLLEDEPVLYDVHAIPNLIGVNVRDSLPPVIEDESDQKTAVEHAHISEQQAAAQQPEVAYAQIVEKKNADENIKADLAQGSSESVSDSTLTLSDPILNVPYPHDQEIDHTKAQDRPLPPVSNLAPIVEEENKEAENSIGRNRSPAIVSLYDAVREKSKSPEKVEHRSPSPQAISDAIPEPNKKKGFGCGGGKCTIV